MSSTQKGAVCRGCGHRDGTHVANCLIVERAAKNKLQAECDHGPECGVTYTTGDLLGHPCCGRCGLELRPKSGTLSSQLPGHFIHLRAAASCSSLR